MTIAACLWCETSLKPGTPICPECGLQSPTAEQKAPTRSRSRTAMRRGRRLLLAIVAVPSMLSAAYAAHTGAIPLVSTDGASDGVQGLAPVIQAPAAYSDPLQRSVWVAGAKSVQQALAQPTYSNFAGSYVDVAAGHIVTFCGEVAGTSGFDSESGARRFISIFGQTQATTLEGTDASFDVLWNRVCARSDIPA